MLKRIIWYTIPDVSNYFRIHNGRCVMASSQFASWLGTEGQPSIAVPNHTPNSSETDYYQLLLKDS